MDALTLLGAAYRPLIDFAADLDEERGWAATALPGWTVRDLVLHLAGDAQRALVALATPSSGDPDTDAISYWRQWTPGTDGAQAGLRAMRIMASVWTSVRGPAELYVETARAVLVAAAGADPGAVVRPRTGGSRSTRCCARSPSRRPSTSSTWSTPCTNTPLHRCWPRCGAPWTACWELPYRPGGTTRRTR